MLNVTCIICTYKYNINILYICKLNIKAYDRAITLIFEGPKKYLNPTLKVI